MVNTLPFQSIESLVGEEPIEKQPVVQTPAVESQPKPEIPVSAPAPVQEVSSIVDVREPGVEPNKPVAPDADDLTRGSDEKESEFRANVEERHEAIQSIQP